MLLALSLSLIATVSKIVTSSDVFFPPKRFTGEESISNCTRERSTSVRPENLSASAQRDAGDNFAAAFATASDHRAGSHPIAEPAKRTSWHWIPAREAAESSAYLPRRAENGTRHSAEHSERFPAEYRSDPRRSSRSLRLAEADPWRAAPGRCSGSAPTAIASTPRRPLRRLRDRSSRAHPPARTLLPSAVREAKAENSTLVRPEQGGPQISVRAPRGKPPRRNQFPGCRRKPFPRHFAVAIGERSGDASTEGSSRLLERKVVRERPWIDPKSER